MLYAISSKMLFLLSTVLLFCTVEANPLYNERILTPSKVAPRYAAILGESASLVPRVILTSCSVTVSTDGWTTCASLIAKFQIPLAKFVSMNPTVGTNCQSFKPGAKYCVRRPYEIPISTTGLCGSNSTTPVTCIGSSFGSCCGKNGLCGSTDASCAIGNCQAGICPGIGYSYDGKCGTQNNNLLCGGPWGNCCSKTGQCGSTSDFCGVGNCQSGACLGASTTTTSRTSTTTTKPLPTPRTPSPDGTCGYTNRYICNGTNPQFSYGKCCSAAGYCGLTEHHCNSPLGCQAEFGLCDTTYYVTITQLTTTTSAVPTTTRSTTPINTPTPFITGMVSNCDTFEFLNAGETCASIAGARGVSLADFMRFNPGIPAGCMSGLWLGWYVCVSIVGHQLGAPYTPAIPPSPHPTHMVQYAGWRLWGCVTGYTSVSLILTGRYADDYMTVEKCITRAVANGALWAGIETGYICRYGTTLVLPATEVYPASRPMTRCNMRCYGDTETLCGSSNIMSLYEKM